MKMRIGIIGTRGIPNHYGGFEQFAEYLSEGLVKRGHEVYVYNSHKHPYQADMWKGVHIIHRFDPEGKLGTAGQFIYDLNCTLDARKRKYDILLFLGYTSSSIWGRLYPSKSVIVSNMDGLEWKRSKYSAKVQRFLKYAESLAVRFSDYLIADSIGIQKYLTEHYEKPSVYIPYGASVFSSPEPSVLDLFQLNPLGYHMLMARMEPENNVEMILDGFTSSSSPLNFIVVGNASNQYGIHLKQKFLSDQRIKFLGAIYNQEQVANLSYYSSVYFHGHSVGGTNPSLLEAMARHALIAAHQNPFNEAILGEDAFYFSSAHEVQKIINQGVEKASYDSRIKANMQKVEQLYNWDGIINAYEDFCLQCIQ